MSEEEFLEKYGKVKVTFSEMFKYRVTYKNTELGIWVSGNAEYRDSISNVEDVYSIFDLEYFRFGFIS